MNKQQEYNTIKKPSFMHHLLRWLYSLILLCLLPLLLLVFRRKLYQPHEKLSHRKFSERFGYVPPTFLAGGIHIHCVSVGELNAAKGLIDNLLLEYAHLPITLTTSSVTGAVHAQNLFNDKVQHCYLPIDLPFFMRRFYKRIQPTLCMVTEVEIWPNMVNECVRRGCPLILINARMTARSLESYRRVSWLFRRTLRLFNEVCAQSSESFENFLAFGLYKKHLKLSRNMKFDLLPQESDEWLAKKIAQHFTLQGRPVLLAASTHDPEEKLILSVFMQLKQHLPSLQLIVVPRHPHRFESVYQIFKASGYETAKVSDYPLEGQSEALNGFASLECIVVDKMGWLKACYQLCNVAFIGGSFAEKGGHNALEAALYAKPMVMGPSIFNNPIICQHLVEENALVIAHTQEALTESLLYWLNNKHHAALDGERGSKVLLRNAGAVEYTMGVIRRYIPSKY